MLMNTNIVIARKMRSKEKAGRLVLSLIKADNDVLKKSTEGKLVNIAKAIKMDTRDLVKILWVCIVDSGKGRSKAFEIPHLVREFESRARESAEIFEIMTKKERLVAEAIVVAILKSIKSWA